jgi:hypothetical protein
LHLQQLTQTTKSLFGCLGLLGINKKYRILSWQQQKLMEMELTYNICCKEQSLKWTRLAPHHQ